MKSEPSDRRAATNESASLGAVSVGVFIADPPPDRKSTRLNSSHSQISYAVLCLKKKRSLPRDHASVHHTLVYFNRAHDRSCPLCNSRLVGHPAYLLFRLLCDSSTDLTSQYNKQ